MKQLILSVCAMLCGAIGYSQNASAISRKPINANGYLILDNYAYPSVDHWYIELLQPTSDPVTPFRTITTKNIWGSNFGYFPPSMYNGSTQMHIVGYHGRDVIVEETNSMVIGPVSEYLCSTICNGPDYVYELTNWDINPGGYRIIMGSPGEGPDGFDFYYEWFKAADFASGGPLGPQNPAYHGMNDFVMLGQNVQNGYIITQHVPQGTYFENRFGDPINGDLVGVKKYLGTYINSLVPFQSNELADDVCEESLSMSGLLHLVNMNEDNPFDVECEGREIHEHEAGEPEAELNPCLETWTRYLFDEEDPFSGVYNPTNHTILLGAISFTAPCGEDPSVPVDGSTSGGHGIAWPVELAAIQISPIDDLSGSVTYKREDFYDRNGDFQGGSMTLPAGLAQVTFMYANGARNEKFVNSSRQSVTTLAQADVVQFTAYPVPVVNNDFNLKLISSEHVSFTHEVRDQYGNRIYSKNYTLDANREITDAVVFPGGLRSGTYFNKLIFSDNSEINFQIVK